VITLLQNFFGAWLLVESTLNTAKNSGFRTRQFFFVDESFLLVNEDRMGLYYSTYPNLSYPATVARHGVEYFRDVLELASKFHDAKLDEEEIAALLFIILIDAANKLVSDKTPLAEQLRVVFQELRTHYQNTYEDVAVRMGNMLLLLNEFYSVRRHQKEHHVIQRLNGRVNELDVYSMESTR